DISSLARGCWVRNLALPLVRLQLDLELGILFFEQQIGRQRSRRSQLQRSSGLLRVVEDLTEMGAEVQGESISSTFIIFCSEGVSLLGSLTFEGLSLAADPVRKGARTDGSTPPLERQLTSDSANDSTAAGSWGLEPTHSFAEEYLLAPN